MGRPDGSWYWVVERDDAVPGAVRAGDGRSLTRREHGSPGRAIVRDESGSALPVATLLRACAALRPLSGGASWSVRLEPRGTTPSIEGTEVTLDGPWIASEPSRHSVERAVRALTGAGRSLPMLAATEDARAEAIPVGPAARRVLFFESLMNSDLPHNDTEISQGVIHMASALRAVGTEVVLANVKMSITDHARPLIGMESLEAALAGGPIELVCITLLEGYWDGVKTLVRELRRLGCRAHVAVGGVMASLAPEHVAAHLPDVSFVCRGAGEYFVPRLVSILGPDASIDRPFSSTQETQLLAMQGLLAMDRASPGVTLISAVSSATVLVDDLDAVALDLDLLEPRHLVNGVEISTARGCIHKCTFCSILGRQSYQARTSEGLLDLLRKYEARYRAMYGEDVPKNAYRVHISDDDFACDRERAATFLRALPSTPFRLASIQVSVADLCRKEAGILLPEPDRAIVDAIVPECFADAHAKIPARDYVVDHRSRRWSAYLAIGVETFADSELRRLGKGYRREHVRAIVRELARKRVHVDAYFISSNADTTMEDLVSSVEEVCRLKIRYPQYFHVRFPIVPRLVSYATSASHRRMMLRGETSRMVVREHARVPSHPELDYAFVEHDVSRDPFVEDAVSAGFFTDERRYTTSIERLRAIVSARRSRDEDPGARRTAEGLLRRLDDLPRRLAFAALREARDAARRDPASREAETAVLESVEAVLGPRDGWLRAFKRSTEEGTPRLVVIPTWQCELRCSYCWIPKQDGRVMPKETLERSIDLLMGSERPALMLQFFGGEAAIEWALVQHGIEHAEKRASELGKEISFVLSSNGWSLDDAKLAWLAHHPVKLELSLDDDPETQNVFRIASDKAADSYVNGIAPRVGAILGSGLDNEVIMVVHPKNASKVAHNFSHIAGLGFRRIQINFALGPKWSSSQMSSFAAGLLEIGEALRACWARGDTLALVNLERRPMPILLNGEITVDWDGTIYGGNGFLHETKHKDRFVIGHLDDGASFDRYWLDGPSNEYLLEWSYPPEEMKNNLEVGKIFASFVTWMREGAHAPVERERPAAASTENDTARG